MDYKTSGMQKIRVVITYKDSCDNIIPLMKNLTYKNETFVSGNVYLNQIEKIMSLNNVSNIRKSEKLRLME